MITFKEFLVESFDSSYPVNYRVNNPNFAHFTFTDKDESEFAVDIHRTRVIDKTYVEMAFRVKNKGDTTYRMQPTGKSGNPLKIYSTIGEQLRNYIKANPADIITFSAASLLTLNIYNVFAKKIAAELNGRVEKKNNGKIWEIHL